ncbi:MAG: hypothetical protein IJ057_10355 [Bacteroidales bacterium]|nr:hypothetical protein [Bacteroidales bacterium]
MRGDNYRKMVRLVKAIVDEHYEPHSHRGSQIDIFRRYVVKVYPMSAATFRRMMSEAIAEDGYIGMGGNRTIKKTHQRRHMDELRNQLSLFD